MPEVNIVIGLSNAGKAVVSVASVKGTTDSLGKEDSVEKVLKAAADVRDFINHFDELTTKEE